MVIKFGPAGIGPVKDSVSNLEELHRLGLRACEIAFTYGVYMKDEKDKKEIEEIKKTAKKLGMELTIHAPYWINLNSKEKKKVEDSKKRILSCCRIGDKLGVEKVIFHPGFYAGRGEEETYDNIKNAILYMQREIKKNKWKIKLAPETMGKVNVFGSIEQISKLVEDTGCSFCLDFAHILARDKKIDYEKIKKLFKSKDWHCHFSGIEYSEKGERRHLKTSKKAWKELLDNLPKNKDIVMINESPDTIEDSVEGLKLSKG